MNKSICMSLKLFFPQRKNIIKEVKRRKIMENLKIEATKDTPEVNLDASGNYIFSGEVISREHL